MSIPLLKTKLYITPGRPELVSRTRLIERVKAGFSRKLTLISAPAGFGKTTLLSACVAQCKLLEPTVRVAWLSLDEGDNDLTRFLIYFVTALQTANSTFGQSLVAALQSPGPINVNATLTTLLNELDTISQNNRESPAYILILDDYHVIESQAIDKAMAFLLDHLPPRIHLVIASRTDPTLPLSRLRARGQLTELRASDLRFTTAEVATFLQKAVRLPIADDDILTLEERTEGWITGLQLAAVAMQSLEHHEQIARFVRNFGGSHRYVIDYLMDEVLERQSPQVQTFLLQTSILDRLTAPLCNAVAEQEDGQILLERLDAANLFLVSLDDERRWYRYHHLFADLLLLRLRQTQPEEVPNLHYRASRWYAYHGFQLEAVHHAIAGDDLERAADLIEATGLNLIGQGAFTTVQNWIDKLSTSLVKQRPYLCVICAWVANFTRQLEVIESYLQDAERALLTAAMPFDEKTIRDVRGHIATLRAWNARRHRDNALAIALLTETGDCLEDSDAFVRTFANLNLGLAYLDGGALVKAAAALREAVAQGDTSGNEFANLIATSQLAAVMILQGRLHDAETLCRGAIRDQLSHHKRPPPTLCMVHLRLAWVLAEWNDVDGYFAHLSQSIILADQIGFDSVVTAGSISLVWERQILAEQGAIIEFSADVAKIIDRALNVGTDVGGPQPASESDADFSTIESQNIGVYLADDAYFEVWPGYSGIARARKLAEDGKVEEALGLLAQIYESAQAVEGIGLMIEARVSAALIHQSQDNLDCALKALDEALYLSEPEGYVRTYVDRATPMARLLGEAAARGLMPDYTTRLLAAFDASTKGDSPPHSQPLIEPLSKRELEVLALIAEGLSNREIGERLFLALTTVKGHNRRIYGKLGVQRRTEAVARARELGLL